MFYTRFSAIFLLCFLFLFAPAVSLSAQSKKRGVVSITDGKGNTSSGKMKKGKKTGEWNTFNHKEEGRLLYSEHYVNGQLHGEKKTYRPDGSVLTAQYAHGRLNGTSVLVDKKGDTSEVKTYRNDTLSGYAFVIEKGNRKEQGNYVNGQKEGWWVSHRTINRVAITDSAYYHLGVQHGAAISYYGAQRWGVVYFVNGLAEGGDTMYYTKDGQIRTTGYSHNGMRDSVHREYALTGELTRETWYRGNTQVRYDSAWQLTGAKRMLKEVTLYNDDGSLYHIVKYNQDGTTNRLRYYGSDGLIDSTIEYASSGQYKKNYYDQNLTTNDARLASFHQWQFNDRGQPICHGQTNGNHRQGRWTWLDNTGRTTEEIVYEPRHSLAKSYTAYYPNGKTKITGLCTRDKLTDSIRVYTAAGKELKAGTPQYDKVLADHFLVKREVRYSPPGELIEEPIVYDLYSPAELAPPVAVEVEKPKPKDEVFVVAEQMPLFPGDSMTAFLQHNLVYPAAEKAAGKEGTVYVQFIVGRDGSISDIKVLKHVPGAPGFSEEAVRVIGLMPKWSPGMMNGRPIAILQTVPVRFKL